MIKYALLIILSILFTGNNNLYAQAHKHHADPCLGIHAGTFIFPKGSAKITNAAKQQLAQLIYDMLLYKRCHVVLMGWGNKNKQQVELAKKRVEAIADYLAMYHIDKSRLILATDQDGYPDHVWFRAALPGEAGNPTPPHSAAKRD